MTPARCPHCGRTNTEHDSINEPGATRDDGDLSICWKCQSVAVYEVSPLSLRLRAPTDAELREIMTDPDVARALSAMDTHRDPSVAVRAARETGRR